MKNDGLTTQWLYNRLSHREEVTPEDRERMDKGLALGKAMENLERGHDVPVRELERLFALDYSFDFRPVLVELELPQLCEVKFERNYGDITVVGKVDGVIGLKVIDYKTTQKFEAEWYDQSYQWRYYLDLTNCEEFEYQVFTVERKEKQSYVVTEYHHLVEYAYAEMHDDCERLAHDYGNLVLAHQKLMSS
jgi:hypothetical protein